MARGTDIVVAGAGAVGSAVGFVLARAGHAVTVVDPTPCGANASAVAAGMLAPGCEILFDAASADHHALLVQARDLWPALAAEIGLPLARDGALAIGTRGEVETWAARLEEVGADARVIGPDSATPPRLGLAAGAWAVFTPGDWRLDPAMALAALRQAAEQAGARFVAGRVLGFDGHTVAIDGAPAIAAEQLVLATGAARDLARLAPELEVLEPIKGHILRAAGAFAAAPVIRAGGIYLCRAQGDVVLGASMEPGLTDTRVDPAVVQRLLAAAAPLLDALGPLDWRAAAGVRAATPDGLPLVGEAGAPGVVLAVGARRNGWLLAPLIAQTVLDLREGRPKRPAAAAFDPARRVFPIAR
jgi:glycine oxidase